jgi:DNA-binding CsgD family transcriptional regulator
MTTTQPLPHAQSVPHVLPPGDLRTSPVALLAALLDEVDSGLIVCDGNGAIAYANHAARVALSARKLLHQTDSGLRLGGGTHGQLDMALRQAVSTGRRRMLALTNDPEHLTLSVVPLPRDGSGNVRVLLLFGRHRLCSDLSLEMLGSLYGLTLMERRVMRGLVDELTPREIAGTHGVAISTVRSQLDSIRTKLGAGTIQDLLLRAASLPPMAAALRQIGGRPVHQPLQALAA